MSAPGSFAASVASGWTGVWAASSGTGMAALPASNSSARRRRKERHSLFIKHPLPINILVLNLSDRAFQAATPPS
jgi:hypothetical protein